MITKFEYYKALELADRIKSWREDDKAGYSGEILREAEDMLRRLADRQIFEMQKKKGKKWNGGK